MNRLVSIDPGVQGCGVAHFIDGVLRAAAYVRRPALIDEPTWPSMAHAVVGWLIGKHPYVGDCDLVIELPRVYPAARQKGDQNDLIELAATVGAICCVAPWRSRQRVYPRDWKGTVDPDVMIQRVRERLTLQEHGVIELPAASLQHNVLDAVGIGLHRLGRLAPRRVYPR